MVRRSETTKRILSKASGELSIRLFQQPADSAFSISSHGVESCQRAARCKASVKPGVWWISKSESRNPKSERNPKPEVRICFVGVGSARRSLKWVVAVSDFGFGVCFGFRASDFGFGTVPALTEGLFFCFLFLENLLNCSP